MWGNRLNTRGHLELPGGFKQAEDQTHPCNKWREFGFNAAETALEGSKAFAEAEQMRPGVSPDFPQPSTIAPATELELWFHSKNLAPNGHRNACSVEEVDQMLDEGRNPTSQPERARLPAAGSPRISHQPSEQAAAAAADARGSGRISCAGRTRTGPRFGWIEGRIPKRLVFSSTGACRDRQ